MKTDRKIVVQRIGRETNGREKFLQERKREKNGRWRERNERWREREIKERETMRMDG